MRTDREIHVIDSRTASMGVGQLAQIGAELAAEGVSAAEVARVLEERKADVDLFVALDTLEYLKRGGRISGARAAVGTMLSIKPIITVNDGIVENADRVRSRQKARERVLELLTAKPARAGRDPPQHERRRRRVPRAVRGAVGPGPVAGPDDAHRAVRRAPPRPRLRRRGGRPQGTDPAPLGTARVTVRLRDGDEGPMANGRARLYSGSQGGDSRRRPTSRPAASSSPWGRPDDDPSIEGGVHRPAHLRILRS